MQEYNADKSISDIAVNIYSYIGGRGGGGWRVNNNDTACQENV